MVYMYSVTQRIKRLHGMGQYSYINLRKQKKENLAGRVPIQIKGTEKVIVSDTATFSCSVADLNNYYKDGGCVFSL